MTHEMESLEPIKGADRELRRGIGVRGELILAVLPTATVLIVLGLVEALSQQRLLFASLASSAFLIYLDPQHGMNSVRTLVTAQALGAVLGWAAYATLGPGYLGAGSAMVAMITLMIVLDVVHPPAVATALSFALRAGDASNIALFGLAIGVTAVLIVLQRATVWMLGRYRRH